MPFEPTFPQAWSHVFHGEMDTHLIDGNGIPDTTIISMTDQWTLRVDWSVNGLLVGSIGGTWHVRCYLESIGPGPEFLVASRDVTVTGGNNYSESFTIGPNMPPQAGLYKLVSVITYSNLLNQPGLFAGYDEFGLVQFYPGPSLP